MINYILSVVLVCLPPIVKNQTKLAWDEQDDAALKHAVESGCKSQFGEASPCLKEFIKVDQGIYEAICGPKGP